jgi:type IV secretion system protein VirB10
VNEPIEDKAPKPPGLLPKHVQSWLIVGLAVLMVLIMWLTGSKKPRATSQAGPPALIPPPLVEVNEGKIAELQNRIEQLQREQLLAQNALTQQTRVLAAGAGETGPAVAPGTAPATERVEDPIETERKKRGYLSLFASNVALSYRKSPEGSSRSTAEPTSTNSELGIRGALPPPIEAASLAQVLRAVQLPGSPVVPPQILPPSSSRPSATASPAEPEPEKKEVMHPAAASGARATATGKSYVLFEGTILETVLVNRLDGAFTGPIECLVTTDLYSHDRQQLLIRQARGSSVKRKVEPSGAVRRALPPLDHAGRLFRKS